MTQFVEGKRHFYEAEMKERERTAGDPGHTAVPDDSGPQGGQIGTIPRARRGAGAGGMAAASRRSPGPS